MRFLLFCLFFSFSGIIIAQSGKVQVIKDARLDGLVAKQSGVIPPEVRPQIDGYRVQVFFDSNKEAVMNAKNQFVARFSKIDTYISYNAPNFFLKVGDFRTRLEAERIKSKIEAEFPTSFIVREKVFLPRLEKEEFED